MRRILFVTSEAHPLVKTGGLGDVSGSLPAALRGLGEDVQLVLPGYRQVLDHASELRVAARLDPPLAPGVRLLEGVMPESGVPLWVVDSPVHFDRAGNPYIASDGRDWSDNAARFAAFGRAVVELACGRAGLDWVPQVVHCNDWQTGLVPALLSLETSPPPTLFTIHNLAYQGLFPWPTFDELRLPLSLGTHHGLEFHGELSFMKGGLAFADLLTTVSPTYAREIRTADFGHGLEGLLQHRADRLRGILNGVDYGEWDPARDRQIARRYGIKSIRFKGENKKTLLARFGLDEAQGPLIGMVGRLVWQKGIDLVAQALPSLIREGARFVILGTGERPYESALAVLAERYPGRVAAVIGYDEALAHLIEAGADLFLMPSRYEPCGLNQIYSLRYGTLPIVRRTGGLADTVVDADPAALRSGTATGFVFDAANADALVEAVRRALLIYRQPALWRRMMTTAMAQDFSWTTSAERYRMAYREAAALTTHHP